MNAMQEIFILTLQIIGICIAFIMGRYGFPYIDNKMDTIKKNIEYIKEQAERYITYIEHLVNTYDEFKDYTGEDKFAYVTTQIEQLCYQYKVDVTIDEVEAIVQQVYDNIKDKVDKIRNK